ncbi:unnamed protein product [Enterobius vermicularis]|uniref:Transmembrane protein n=1 Tax=Enterobius vermicularis TaxID=51028 RepID=A0A0N4V8A3_ENTVE|nr:unnamed protein product [Enterobius vermicularis]
MYSEGEDVLVLHSWRWGKGSLVFVYMKASPNIGLPYDHPIFIAAYIFSSDLGIYSMAAVEQLLELLIVLSALWLDVPLLEARASALVSACWTLSFPFILACGDSISALEAILKEMDTHVDSLRDIVANAEQNFLESRTDLASTTVPMATFIEETALVEVARNKTETLTSPQTDEAPADPSAS